jgi:sugar O-acyltransferase (sialic acid O-acetyltransferase NeuD family)
MKDDRDVYVIGAGGHSKVVVSTLQAAGYRIRGLVDDDPGKWGTKVLDLPVVGPIPGFERLASSRVIIAVGDNSARKAIAERLGKVEWLTVVHPAAYVHPSVRLGAGTVVFAGVVVQPDATVGSHCIINTSASVDHDCVLGDFTHLAPGTHLGGGVKLGEGVFLGIGSAVLPSTSVGDWAVVGGGGVVTTDLESGVVAVGVPAKPIKRRLSS